MKKMTEDISKVQEKMNQILIFKSFNNSTILKNRTEDLIYLNSLIKNLKALKLLLRGSREGFSAKAFHNYCDNKGPTITIV